MWSCCRRPFFPLWLLPWSLNGFEQMDGLKWGESRERQREKGYRDRERDRENEGGLTWSQDAVCYWEEMTGHYSTTKSLLISLLGFNWGWLIRSLWAVWASGSGVDIRSSWYSNLSQLLPMHLHKPVTDWQEKWAVIIRVQDWPLMALQVP